MKPVRLFYNTAITTLVALCCVLGGLIMAESKVQTTKPDRVVTIVAERFVFVPSRVKLKKGEVVEFRIRSLDTNHGFLIHGTDVNVVVPKRGKGEARVLFRAQRRGTFPFVCSKACGAGHTMMRGNIVVD